MFEDIVSFDVVLLSGQGAVTTTVSHWAGKLKDGAERDVVRFEQGNPERPDEPDVVLLDRTDLKNIYKIMKGH